MAGDYSTVYQTISIAVNGGNPQTPTPTSEWVTSSTNYPLNNTHLEVGNYLIVWIIGINTDCGVKIYNKIATWYTVYLDDIMKRKNSHRKVKVFITMQLTERNLQSVLE